MQVHVSALSVVSKLTSDCVVQQLPTGYDGGKRTRCTDRFVRYPYPKHLYSQYKQEFYGNKMKDSNVRNHKLAFNPEKETKIINPHKMELLTTAKTVHTGAHGERA